jgi:hypothetical protein
MGYIDWNNRNESVTIKFCDSFVALAELRIALYRGP